ncbi:hypothetical protein NNRS527_01361 [Nitrosospira sp. NRS527]|nr:hypothetical protein NNRS527_01361 [Nitrosospira sp. NRS527]
MHFFHAFPTHPSRARHDIHIGHQLLQVRSYTPIYLWFYSSACGNYVSVLRINTLTQGNEISSNIDCGLRNEPMSTSVTYWEGHEREGIFADESNSSIEASS